MSTRTDSPRLVGITAVDAQRNTEPASPPQTSVDGGRWELFDKPVTPEHRRQVAIRALEILVPTLAPSQSNLDPVMRFGGMLEQTLDWLDGFAGLSYQDRWQASGMDRDPGMCKTGPFTKPWPRHRLLTAIDGLVTAGVLRPSYSWLVSGKHRRLHKMWVNNHDRALFAALTQAATVTGVPALNGQSAVNSLIRMSCHTGRSLAALDCEDLLAYRASAITCRGTTLNLNFSIIYQLSRMAGLFPDGPQTFTALRSATQLGPAQMVDRAGVLGPTMRTLLIEYLTERRAGIDYISWDHLADNLCRLFWRDIELAHPGIDTHRLTRTQIEDWKRRISVLADGRPRRQTPELLMAVRSFYLDINHWANDYPEQWAQWACPSPITRADTRCAPRKRRAQTARMHARVREIAPQLPTLVRSVRQHRAHTAALLDVAALAAPGTEFDHAGRRYTRVSGHQARCRLHVCNDAGVTSDIRGEADRAFWIWAFVDVLRHSGIRIEEMLELTHHSIRPYRKPDGQIIPLLQIAPSKTDCERVIPAGPELASVLAQIVTRVTGPDGKIPLTCRYDQYERAWSPPQPHLFIFWRPTARTFAPGTVRDYLTQALGRADMSTEPGRRVTPHDFRRLFTTEAVNAGLPVHIAAAILGHQDLNTTMGYTAIYPQEVFARYQEFIDRRRAARPTDEYRAPTRAELDDFAEHFGKRRIELGNCVRPYASPCIHEHACLRCPFQQINPDRMSQLRALETDIQTRIVAAREQQWLGDVAQLEQTLERVTHKRTQLEELPDHPELITAHPG